MSSISDLVADQERRMRNGIARTNEVIRTKTSQGRAGEIPVDAHLEDLEALVRARMGELTPWDDGSGYNRRTVTSELNLLLLQLDTWNSLVSAQERVEAAVAAEP